MKKVRTWHLGRHGRQFYASSEDCNILFTASKDTPAVPVSVYDKKRNTRYTDSRYLAPWASVCNVLAGELSAAGWLN